MSGGLVGSGPGGPFHGATLRIGRAVGVTNDATGNGRPLKVVAKALVVFMMTVGLAILLGLFLFHPLLVSTANGNGGETGARVDEIIVGEGEVDSVDRSKYWGDGPVTGPAFNPQDPTYAIPLEDAGFRVPASWSCSPSEPEKPGDVKWVCVDNLLDGRKGQPAGVVTIRPCQDQPCDQEQERREARDEEAPGPVKRPDQRTAYVEWTEEQGGGTLYYLAMRHFWDREGDGQLDSEMLTTFSAPIRDDSARRELQKITNDIREAAG